MTKNYFLLLMFLGLSLISANADIMNVVIDKNHYILDSNDMSAAFTGTDGSGSIVIPETIEYNNQSFTITRIDDRAFYKRSDITHVSIPKFVNYIGIGCFRETMISEIELPNGLKEIGGGCFSSTQIVSINIPNSVETIGTGCFTNCVNLKNLHWPDNVTTIPWNTFIGCTSLTSFDFSKIKVVGASSFSGAGLIEAILPENVESIESYSFSDMRNLKKVIIKNDNIKLEYGTFSCELDEDKTPYSILEEVILPKGMTGILNGRMFRNCNSLSHIDIPKGITDFGAWLNTDVFLGCISLKSITLPEKLKYICYGCFAGCSSLQEIKCLSEIVPEIDNTDGGTAFKGTLYKYGTVKVRPELINDFKNAYGWKDWKYIVALDDEDYPSKPDPEPELEHVSQLLSNKWSGEAYKAQVIAFDSGKDFGDWNESNPNYNVVVATPANDASGKQWFDIDYKLTNSTSSWGEKQAPFKNWCSGYGDIYVRREFIYDGTAPAELFLACGHDDAPSEYYLNGVKVWTISDGWKEDDFVKLKPSQAALLKPGEKNVLAFHIHQNWGGMYADGGLYTDRSVFGFDAAKAFDIDASSAGLGGNEGSTKLFDEKTSTKWGFSGKQYVIFHPTTTLVANSYAITTANDNEQFTGRNPKSWTVYGANTSDWPDYGSADWQKIAEVNNDQVMQDKNFTRYQFPLDVRGKSYNYYMWEISSVQGGGFCQVSEFSIESTIATGITDVIIEVDAPAYNLAGQRVTDTTKGIIVKSGKKYIRK